MVRCLHNQHGGPRKVSLALRTGDHIPGAARDYAVDHHRDLFGARNAGSEDFQSAKTYGIAACGVGILIWFGLFSAIGGAYFQMWQTDAGAGALANASMFSVQLAVVWLLVSQKDE